MTEIASHRGGALLLPENSRIAFEATAKLPVEQVEFDIHPTSDGRLVVHHDATLDRTTTGSGPLVAQDWATLRKKIVLKNTGGQSMLLFDEVMEIFRPTSILLRVEIKADANHKPYPGLGKAVAAALAKCKMLDRSHITSFQLDTVLEAARAHRPRNHVWLITPPLQDDLGLDRVIGVAKAEKVPALALRQNMLDAKVMSRIRRAKLGIGAWACNDDVTIAKALALGVDSFTTDRPDLAIAQRTALKRGKKHG